MLVSAGRTLRSWLGRNTENDTGGKKAAIFSLSHEIDTEIQSTFSRFINLQIAFVINDYLLLKYCIALVTRNGIDK